MNACSVPTDSIGLIGSITQFVDCRAEMLTTGAWQAFAAPGSTLTLVLTGFLTIFVALIGYRLLLGEEPSVRTGTLAMVRIGMVFALATSWPVYSSLVYNFVTDGPSQMVRELGSPAALPGADGTLVRRLDLADGALVQLAIAGAGSSAMAPRDVSVQPPPFAGFNAFALGGSRIIFLLTAVAGLAVVRIVAALLLVLGPFFIAFLLFDGTRSLFEGWVRVLAGAAIAAIGVSVVLGLQLALVEPWLAASLARRAAGEILPSLPTDLLVITLLFAIVMVALIGASVRLAGAFRLAGFGAHISSRQASVGIRAVASGAQAGHLSAAQKERTRAAALSDGLMTLQRHEIRRAGLAMSSELGASTVVGRSGTGAQSGLAGIRTSSAISPARRSRTRVSASSNRRDSRI